MYKLSKPDARFKWLIFSPQISWTFFTFLYMFIPKMLPYFTSMKEDVKATEQRLSNDKSQTKHSRAVADPQLDTPIENQIIFLNYVTSNVAATKKIFSPNTPIACLCFQNLFCLDTCSTTQFLLPPAKSYKTCPRNTTLFPQIKLPVFYTECKGPKPELKILRCQGQGCLGQLRAINTHCLTFKLKSSFYLSALLFLTSSQLLLQVKSSQYLHFEVSRGDFKAEREEKCVS